VPFTGTLHAVGVQPVLRAGQVIGTLITGGSPEGDPLPPAAAHSQRPRPLPDRLIGRRGTRLVVLALHEIRFAESDGSTIWLTTDHGRLQATSQGLDNLERQLANDGFLRVHRRFLVNLRRVREIEQGFKGALFLSTDIRTHETVPVSRRHAAILRRVLGA
jgi:DNA-binding LytR/AlgR family response regulator